MKILTIVILVLAFIVFMLCLRFAEMQEHIAHIETSLSETMTLAEFRSLLTTLKQ